MGLSRRLFQGVILTGGNSLRICVRFFALYGELIGCDEEEYVLKFGSKVEDLINLVVEKHEHMKGVKGMLRFIFLKKNLGGKRRILKMK